MQKNLSISAKVRLRILISLLLGTPVLGFSAEFQVKNADELQNALLSIGHDNEQNQIIFTDDMQLNHALPALRGKLTLDGQGHKINGRQQYRIFSIAEGQIHIKNLDIVDGKAQGQAGTHYHFGGGGGGAAGLGGGLFIRTGQVYLEHVHFIGNQAIGGAGGDYVPEEGDGSGGAGAAFYFAPTLEASLATASSLNTAKQKIPQTDSKTAMTAVTPDLFDHSPYQLANQTNVVITPEPEIKHIAQAGHTDMTTVIYRQGGIADNSGGIGYNGDFGSGGGGGGNGVIDGGFGGNGGFGGGGGGGGYGFGFAQTDYGSSLNQNDLLDHGDNRGERGFAAGFGGKGGFADDSGGGAGGGGAGLGGAIFIQNGELKLEKVKFSYNLASGGVSGAGAHKGSIGSGRAGALFICTKADDPSCNALVRVCEPPVYIKNIVTSTDPDWVGDLLPLDCTPPPEPEVQTTADLEQKMPTSIPIIPPNRKTFSWQGETVSAWALWLGGNLGERNIYDSGHLAPDAQVTVDNLPLDGSFIFSRLWYSKNNQDWYFRDYRYNLNANQWVEITAPSLLSDNQDNIVYGKQHTFHWQGSGIKQWRLSIGYRKGGADIYFSGNLKDKTQAVVTRLPANGRTVYIRLWFWHQQQRSWQLLDYQYTSAPALMDINPPT